jgi:hypothetical protein
MGCCRVPAGYVLFVPVLFMWNVVVLLLIHLLGAADCVVASYVFVIEIQVAFRVLVYQFAFVVRKTPFDHIPRPHSYSSILT